jgi:hypothetical protein
MDIIVGLNHLLYTERREGNLLPLFLRNFLNINFLPTCFTPTFAAENYTTL